MCQNGPVAGFPALAEDSGAGWPIIGRARRACCLAPNPIETMALLPDHPPVWLTWRGVRRRIARADGPERIFGEWWTREAERIAVRDYFRVEDDAGERLLALSRGRRRGRRHRLASLVPARDLWMRPRYAELQVTSHFSFLRGASDAEHLFATGGRLAGSRRLASVDRNSLAGDRPRMAGGEGHRGAAGRRAAGSIWPDGIVGAGLSDRPSGLVTPLPSAHAWQDRGRARRPAICDWPDLAEHARGPDRRPDPRPGR